MTSSVSSRSVVGIDVGAAKKGFHVVALEGLTPKTFWASSAEAVAAWCANAAAIAIDAPCGWSTEGVGRACERELAQDNISCFLTPTAEVARNHPTDYYGWMLAGEQMYSQLAVNWGLFAGEQTAAPMVFETYPYAVERALRGRGPRPGTKVRVRRQLLCDQGIDGKLLPNLDFVDAGLCAFAAQSYLAGNWKKYGVGETGYIVVPKTRGERDSASKSGRR